MKTLFKFMLSAVLLTGLSCNTDNSYADMDQANAKIVMASKAGTSNPFDYLGELHNNFMTDMHNLKPSKDKIPDLALNFVTENGYEYDTSVFNSNTVSEIMNESMTSEFTEEKIDELGKRFQYSDEYKKELHKLSSFFNADSYENTNDIVNQLNEIEASYLQSKLSEKEKDQLLATIAIARHSADYWISFYPNDSNSNTVASNRIRWWARIFGGIVADTMGAVIGLAGGPVGAVIGGVAASAGVQTLVDDNL
ncbi:hypothetical protein MKJ01_00560 [Chryseobacterium sp. SSA4.19]|uniref:hypothetical protein n=1 Tax=Chryseobacterium sp. SSA4.19 TaxID=2919915 RepID=UPI001F4E222F|nr:hypothetical protein [Chryseobacterium sp. SSA4.19]MCJ8152250.1 hypothetical protein [Chryseobacterium sp. SSA4.19]